MRPNLLAIALAVARPLGQPAGADELAKGILILHEGRVVCERSFGCLKEDGLHAAMPMTKPVTGLLAGIMVVEGELDDTLLVRDIVPEIGDSAFATATVRQVMDMTTGVRFSEDYSDRLPAALRSAERAVCRAEQAEQNGDDA